MAGLPLMEVEEEAPVAAADAMAGLPLMEVEEEVPAAAADAMAGLPLMEVEEEAPAAAAAELPLPVVEEEAPAEPAVAEPEVAESAAVPAVEFMDLGDVQEQVPTVAVLEARIASAPDDWDAHRRLGEVLLDEGQRGRGLAALDTALEGFEQAERLEDAYALNEEILRAERNSIRHQQKRVELSYRQNDRVRLVDAYNELADALLRTNDAGRAVAVYQRVLEHDPTNARARAALDTLAPAPAAPVPEAPAATRMSTQRPAAQQPAAQQPAAVAPEGGYVDLGAFLTEDDAGPMDTRMKVEDEEPTGDEEADFQSMLQAFKKGIAANVGEEDFQSHFDLGVAYKEMGLLDEAIAEFQKALRATDGRLKSSEALGVCFFEKGQFAVAETILRRGLEHQGASEAARIGLLYWLGRAYEEQGKHADALTSYNRVFGVDINFQDVNQRVRALNRAGA
jgi:tetratricopeptide (TPR) repeat protein